MYPPLQKKTTSVQSEGKLATTWGNIRVTALLQNYPNPFNPETWIPFQLAEETDVSIEIYDVGGNLIKTFELGKRPAGFYVEKDHAVHWDGRNNAGEKVSSGAYFYQIVATEGRHYDFTAVRKMVVMK